METTALRPVKLKLDIYGTGNYDGKERPFPSAYINDALSQNILYYCYEEPRGVEELAKLCGVPAYYIEERIANLVKREAVIEPVKGKYQTDFIIWSDKYGIYCEENAEKAMMPIMDRMIEALQNIAKDAGKIDFYKAERAKRTCFICTAFWRLRMRGSTIAGCPIRTCRKSMTAFAGTTSAIWKAESTNGSRSARCTAETPEVGAVIHIRCITRLADLRTKK